MQPNLQLHKIEQWLHGQIWREESMWERGNAIEEMVSLHITLMLKPFFTDMYVKVYQLYILMM